MNTDVQNNPIKEGHPIFTYFQEVDLIVSLLNEFENSNPLEDNQKWFNIFNELSTIEKRFLRKENQLFPYLEKKGWNGPTKGMWSFHDTIREQFRLLRKNYLEKNYTDLTNDSRYLINNIYRLIKIEETVLFPNSLQLLDELEWIEMSKGEEEIGWMLKKSPPSLYSDKETIETSIEPTEDSFGKERFKLNEGYMNIDQLNLLFKTMPLDLTYVDENDKVLFYNRGEERVFPRSAGVIGREVKHCHPPKSVGTVLEILEKFRKGEQNEASFWINYKERLIYIRYFAVRNENLEYTGVIEISQDITDIKEITGERRLLDWSN
jgi:PAS domain S-box-containing protein